MVHISSILGMLCLDYRAFLSFETTNHGYAYLYIFSIFFSSFISDRTQFLLFVLYSYAFFILFTYLREPWCLYVFKWGLNIEH